MTISRLTKNRDDFLRRLNAAQAFEEAGADEYTAGHLARVFHPWSEPGEGVYETSLSAAYRLLTVGDSESARGYLDEAVRKAPDNDTERVIEGMICRLPEIQRIVSRADSSESKVA